MAARSVLRVQTDQDVILPGTPTRAEWMCESPTCGAASCLVAGELPALGGIDYQQPASAVTAVKNSSLHTPLTPFRPVDSSATTKHRLTPAAASHPSFTEAVPPESVTLNQVATLFFARAHARAHTHTHTRTHARTRTHTHTRTQARARAHTHTHMHAHTHKHMT